MRQGLLFHRRGVGRQEVQEDGNGEKGLPLARPLLAVVYLFPECQGAGVDAVDVVCVGGSLHPVESVQGDDTVKQVQIRAREGGSHQEGQESPPHNQSPEVERPETERLVQEPSAGHLSPHRDPARGDLGEGPLVREEALGPRDPLGGGPPPGRRPRQPQRSFSEVPTGGITMWGEMPSTWFLYQPLGFWAFYLGTLIMGWGLLALLVGPPLAGTYLHLLHSVVS